MTGLSISVIDRHIGSRVRARRTELGVTVAGLAAVLGVDAAEVEMFEAGAVRLDAMRLFHLCRALNTDVSYFYAGFGAPAGQKVPYLRLAGED